MDLIAYNPDNNDVSRILERFIQSGHLNFLIGSGASRPAIELAGDIEAEINALLSLSDTPEANKKALLFIEALEYQNGFLPDGYTEGDDTHTTLTNYLSFLTSVDRMLFERKNILLPRQANIFTTNYDEFIESAARHLPATILNDGFDRRVGGDTFEFSPEILFDRVYRSGGVYENQSEVPTINLVKIHGSLSWKRESEERILFGSHDCTELTTIEKDSPILVAEALSKRAVILPNMRKFESTLLDRVYFDLLRLFSNALEKENALLIVFGFSFADEHILDITRRALRNPTAKIVIFAYSEDSVDEFERKFRSHRNATVVHPIDGDVIDFVVVNKILVDVAREVEITVD